MGAKKTAAAEESARRLAATLQPLGDVTTKSMFGGYGIFHEDKMFGIVDSTGSWFLKADDSTADRFEAAGVEKHGRMPYWRIPEAVAGEEDELLAWAAEAVRVAKG